MSSPPVEKLKIEAENKFKLIEDIDVVVKNIFTKLDPHSIENVGEVRNYYFK